MESFKQILGAEGCSSSESGWTKYISSPTQEDDDDAEYRKENGEFDGIYGGIRRQKRGGRVDEEESDDSMASDASSAPFHYHGTAVSKKDRKDGATKCSSRKNANKLEKKRVDTRRKK
ncbi:small heat shock protein hspM [Senna tora]|uniref:Small heat shock protein hspM n=1 Tax=Senna tora TaxID=362788 RepID=A0A834VZS2_9FABA|nr:small heat shock protein hspM [Senna tora]